jgi:hypothetical protein
MLASTPASILNQKFSRAGIPKRFNLIRSGSNLRSGQGNDEPPQHSAGDRHAYLLRRSSFPLAAWLQREYQRAASPVFPERDILGSLGPRGSRPGGSQPQRPSMKEARLCNRFGSSLFSARLRYVSPLSRSLRAVVGKTGKWRGTIKSPHNFLSTWASKALQFHEVTGAPGRTRTSNPQIRSLAYYLRARGSETKIMAIKY